MAEYIEREAVMQRFADHIKRSNNSDFAAAPTWNQAVQIVDDFPAADVRPVVRGRWIKMDMHKGMEQYKCSTCRSECYVPECMGEPMYAYCPNCGADMREENNG